MLSETCNEFLTCTDFGIWELHKKSDDMFLYSRMRIRRRELCLPSKHSVRNWTGKSSTFLTLDILSVLSFDTDCSHLCCCLAAFLAQIATTKPIVFSVVNERKVHTVRVALDVAPETLFTVFLKTTTSSVS